MSAHDSSQCALIDELAEEFALRYRRGERPALKEYLDKYPELADDIRVLFPALVEMEQVKEEQGDAARGADATPLAETPPLRQIGDYRILREVGRGGMGVVYEAEQVSLGRRVALKVLPAHVSADHQTLERFRREARSAAKLHHTNIVPVFDVGQDGDTCYYAMQFIQGQSLDQIVGELRRQRSGARQPPEMATRRVDAPRSEADGLRPALDQLAQSLLSGRFQVEQAAAPAIAHTESHVLAPDASDPSGACIANTTSSAVLPGQTDLSSVRTDRPHYFQSVARIGWQTAHAMAYAHARGIVHRDIKPSNLLLDTAGVVWITDFGLAKTQDNSLTTTGDIVGTLRYMAPERFKGEGDERADVYGLGLTLYEMLVLRPAFYSRDRLRLIDQIKTQESASPRTVDRRIPRDLETIVHKAINKEVKRRYQSAEEMAEDLRRFLADEPIKARRTSQVERLRLWSRRNPALAALLLVLTLAAVASTMTAFYLRATLLEAEENRCRAEKAELEGEYKLWLSFLSQARARRMSRQSGQRFASLHAIREALALPVPPGHSRDELRTEAIAALCLPDLELVHEGGREIIGASGFAIDAAFQRYAIADKDGKVSILRLSDDKELLQLPGGGRVSEYAGLQFSPDGQFLSQRCEIRAGCRSRLWDLSGPQPRAVLDDNHIHLTFRPDSRQCAASYPGKTVCFFETASGRELRRFRVADMPADFGVSWNPQLPQLLVSTGATLRLLNVDTGEVSAVGPKFAKGHSCSWVDWHPEGRLLAIADDDMKIHLWDVPANRPALPPLEGHICNGMTVRFNHAGDRLLSTDWLSNWRLWDTHSGRLLLTLPASGIPLYFSPDDSLAGAGGNGKVQLFHVRRGEELRTVAHRGPTVNWGYEPQSGSFVDPEGRLYAIGMRGNADGIVLVDLARGEEAALLPLPGNAPIHFDSEGALWTGGSAGLLRWPLTADPKTRQRRYGPPQRILAQVNAAPQGSADLRVLAIPENSRGAVVVHRDSQRRLRLGPQEDVRSCAVSPDGRWVATGSHWLHEGAGAKVWDAHSGKHVTDLPLGSGGVRFSPDGKWLLTTSGGCRLWAVGTWQEGPSLGRGSPTNSSAAFSGDGKLLAIGDEPGVVRLVVTDTGAEIARLTIPEPTRLIPSAFTPDGAHLLATGVETTNLYLFDLRALRAELAELGLDWDAPPLPAAPRGADATPLTAEPLSIHFEFGDLRQWSQADALVKQAAQHIHGKEYVKARTALRQAVKIAPSLAVAHNNLAWLLLTGPKELRDPAQALTEARQAVELESDHAIYANTLGVALYRTGQFAEAVSVLERSLRESEGQSDAFDLFFLAMCHHRLGDAAKAKDCRQRGASWFQSHKGKLTAGLVEELTIFQAEADTVLAQPPGQAKK